MTHPLAPVRRARPVRPAASPPRGQPPAKGRPPVRTHHDEWGKRALAHWLGPLGDIQIDARIAGESRRGDVLYTERRDIPAHRRRLGALGEIARGIVLFELFRNPMLVLELQGCLLKTVDLRAQHGRAARRARKPQSTVVRVALCAVTPSMSAEIAAEVQATRLSPEAPGLYCIAPMWACVLVVVNELPPDPATMWLRLLGRGKVQAQAVKELLAMSKRHPLRDGTLRLLAAWLQSLPPPAQRSEDDRELTMNLEQIYERWERKTLARGRREGEARGEAKGKAAGKAEAVLGVLDARGLAVTAAQREQVLACAREAQLDAWLRDAVTVPSARALLAAPAVRRTRAR